MLVYKRLVGQYVNKRRWGYSPYTPSKALPPPEEAVEKLRAFYEKFPRRNF